MARNLLLAVNLMLILRPPETYHTYPPKFFATAFLDSVNDSVPISLCVFLIAETQR